MKLPLIPMLGATLLSLLFYWTADAQSETVPASPTTVTITVAPGVRQSFTGFGISQNNFQLPYNKLVSQRRELLARLLFRDLHLQTLRLWWQPQHYAPQPGGHDTSDFVRTYVTSGIIADARANGVATLLLAPERVPLYMLQDPAKADSPIKAAEIGSYAALIASFIRQIRDENGVRIDATGVANEPPWFTPETMVTMVKALRSALDKNGLQQVKLIATEQPNNDDTTDRFLAALKADGDAWRALTGISTHSYSMAVRDQEARFVEGANGRNLKEFWITEAGGGPALPTSEPPDDGRQAASMASRFLNDMNHRVTHWVWFLGAEEIRKWPEDFDNVQRLIEYQPLRPGDWYLPLLKYFYFRRLGQLFKPGAMFRESQSSLEGAMTWTYGRKPRLTAAAARNPDGSWAIGLSNYTSDQFEFPNMSQFDRDNRGYPAQTFTVTLHVAELDNAGDLVFRIDRNSETLRDMDEGIVTMHHGQFTIPDVAPLQLVTLQSVPHRSISQ